MSEFNYILEIQNIQKSFTQIPVLKDINIKIIKGEVHAIAGENGAGKSTLMKIITGQITADSGTLKMNGEKVHIRNTTDALSFGISMIHQELTPLPNMTVAENYFLGREICFWNGLLNKRQMSAETQKILDTYGLKISASDKVEKLSIAQLQMLEIIKAVRDNSCFIIMDEPTSSLSAEETKHLFAIIKDLKAKGVTIIYISHRLEDIFEIADKVTVLRDGEFIGTKSIDGIDKNGLIEMMVNRPLENLSYKTEVKGDIVFEVRDLNKKGVFSDISFSVRKGEILGISGLMGAGRSEIARAIFGLDKFDSGRIILDGKEVEIKCPNDAIKKGIAMVSEDRKILGLVLCRSIKENITLPNLKLISKYLFLNSGYEKSQIKKSIDFLSIKCNSMHQDTNTLSGGNQQKVVLAKWLMADLKILILDEPTRGIDIGAKAEIHKLMRELADNGLTIIMISSELPEVLSMSDRILVVSAGKIKAEFDQQDIYSGKITQNDILEKAL